MQFFNITEQTENVSDLTRIVREGFLDKLLFLQKAVVCGTRNQNQLKIIIRNLYCIHSGNLSQDV